MKITSISGYPVNIMYKPNWQHDKRFYVKTAIQTNVIIVIQTDDGLIGVGEAAHSPGLYGETAESTMGAIELFKPHLIGQDVMDIVKINAIMDRVSLVGNIAAKAGIDIALHDAKAKALNVPVYQLLGGLTHSEMKTHINPATVETIVDDTKAFMREGYRVFKIKMSGDFNYDLNMVQSLLDIDDEGDSILFSLDANQGWGVIEAINMANEIEKLKGYKNNVILEQPNRGCDIRGMKQIKNSTSLPLMADDGLRTIEDLNLILDAEAADIVSLKISRNGGIYKTIQMIAMAEAAHIPYIIDEINEMKVANTAVAHVALSAKEPLYTGVCCHLLLENDVVKSGGVIVEDGKVKVTDEPGLGIELVDLKAFDTNNRV